MALTTFVQNSLPSIGEPTHFNNGLSLDVNAVQFPLQVGVPVSPIYTFKVIPAPIDTDCVAVAQSLGSGESGGNLTLRTTVQGTAPNIQSQPFTHNGETGVLLDCERNLTFTFSSATTTETVCTIQGYDFRGVPMQYTRTIAAGSTANAPSIPISLVTSLSFSVNPFSGDGTKTISVGTNNFIGLPYLLTGEGYVINATWNGAALSPFGGPFIVGFNWRANDGYGNYSARGFVNVPSATDGIKTLIVTYYVYGADAELSREIANKNQSQLKVASVKKNASSSYPTTEFPLNRPVFVYPELIPQDLTGLQVDPNIALTDQDTPDVDFLINYYALLAG